VDRQRGRTFFDVAGALFYRLDRRADAARDTPGGNSYACDPNERVAKDERNVTAASGGTSTGKGDHVLSDRSRSVIEATLPVVAENIEEIATRFYVHLFGEHPELLDGTFNRGNQAEKTQQMALAGSVAVFASSLVKSPEQVPEHLLARIAHKHASLGISPEQYDVVHDNLFWAIVDVLGAAVTPEVAAAWDEV
jgi:hemoglobin-like flavoprotein